MPTDELNFDRIDVGTKGQDLVDIFNNNFGITKSQFLLLSAAILRRVISDNIKELKFDETTNKVYYTLDDADVEDRTWKYIGTVWGQLEGNISDQTDLKQALDNKVDKLDYDRLVVQVTTNKTNITTLQIDVSNIQQLVNEHQSQILVLNDDVSDIKMKLLKAVSSETINFLRVNPTTKGVEYSDDGGLSWSSVTGSEKIIEWGQIQGDIQNQADLQAFMHDLTEDVEACVSLVNSFNGRVTQCELDITSLSESFTNFRNQINADLNAHIQNQSNPHNVTAAQVGLGNVDNTSDLNKPLSTAQKQYVDEEIAKVTPEPDVIRVKTCNTEVFESSFERDVLFIIDDGLETPVSNDNNENNEENNSSNT